MSDEPAGRGAMRVAYLLNTYPAPSGTFIRREIEALEEIDVAVTRFAVRRFVGQLVEPADIRDAGQTHYLLEGNLAGLFAAALRELFTNPSGLGRALPVWRTLLRNARGGFVRHVAYLMQASALRQAAARLDVGHVHAHFSNNAAAVAMLSALLGGPRFSFTAHGPDEFVDAPRLSLPMKIERAAFVVAISDYSRNLLAGLAGSDEVAAKIHIARCGIDLCQFEVAPPIQAENKTLVCVGRLCPQKGQVRIPAAVAALKRRFPTIKVVLVGDGESRAEIENEIARHNVGREVVLRGWASNAEVRQAIAESRALLLPSYAEGLPIVIMETFALGRPVITTSIAGIPELVDFECGWLVTPGDHDQLVTAIGAALAADPAQIASMGQKGRGRVERLHDLRQLARELKPLMAASVSAEAPAR